MAEQFCKYKQKDVTYNEYNKNCLCVRLCSRRYCVGALRCAHAYCIAFDASFAKDKAKQCRACLRKTREETQKQR